METSPSIQMKKPSGFFKLGQTYCFSVNGSIYICIGPDWGFNLCLGSILLLANIFFLTIMAPKVDPGMQYLGFFIYTSALIMYLLTALLNPGILTNPWEVELEEGRSTHKLCKECSVVIQEGSEHCFDCQVCVRDYDHHCPLSGKCIGGGNIIPFYGFLISVFAAMVYFAVWFFVVTKAIKTN